MAKKRSSIREHVYALTADAIEQSHTDGIASTKLSAQAPHLIGVSESPDSRRGKSWRKDQGAPGMLRSKRSTTSKRVPSHFFGIPARDWPLAIAGRIALPI